MSKTGDSISVRPTERQEHYLSFFEAGRKSTEIKKALDFYIDHKESRYNQCKEIFEDMPCKQNKQSDTG